MIADSPILLDTCTLLFLAADQSRLSDRARAVISANADALYISAISAFEIGVKCRRGALTLPCAPGDWYSSALDLHGLVEIPVDGRCAIRATCLPPLHKDPADRIIVATAEHRGLTILTPDPLIRAYPDVRVEW